MDEHHKVIKITAVAYWKMVLEQNQEAQARLQRGRIADELAAGDYFRFKPGRSRAL